MNWRDVKPGDKLLIQGWTGMFDIGEPFEAKIEDVNHFAQWPYFVSNGLKRQCGGWKIIKKLS